MYIHWTKFRVRTRLRRNSEYTRTLIVYSTLLKSSQKNASRDKTIKHRRIVRQAPRYMPDQTNLTNKLQNLTFLQYHSYHDNHNDHSCAKNTSLYQSIFSTHTRTHTWSHTHTYTHAHSEAPYEQKKGAPLALILTRVQACDLLVVGGCGGHGGAASAAVISRDGCCELLGVPGAYQLPELGIDEALGSGSMSQPGADPLPAERTAEAAVLDSAAQTAEAEVMRAGQGHRLAQDRPADRADKLSKRWHRRRGCLPRRPSRRHLTGARSWCPPRPRARRRRRVSSPLMLLQPLERLRRPFQTCRHLLASAGSRSCASTRARSVRGSVVCAALLRFLSPFLSLSLSLSLAPSLSLRSADVLGIAERERQSARCCSNK